MAGGQFQLYNDGHLGFFDGTFDFANDTIVAVLLGAGYTPAASHRTYSDVSGSEIADADYAPQTVSGASVTGSNGSVTVSCDDVSYGDAVTIEAKYVALVQQSGGSPASTDRLIGYADLNDAGGTLASTNSTFSVNPSNGLFVDTLA